MDITRIETQNNNRIPTKMAEHIKIILKSMKYRGLKELQSTTPTNLQSTD